jgi:hypothetical protein
MDRGIRTSSSRRRLARTATLAGHGRVSNEPLFACQNAMLFSDRRWRPVWDLPSGIVTRLAGHPGIATLFEITLIAARPRALDAKATHSHPGRGRGSLTDSRNQRYDPSSLKKYGFSVDSDWCRRSRRTQEKWFWGFSHRIPDATRPVAGPKCLESPRTTFIGMTMGQCPNNSVQRSVFVALPFNQLNVS